MKICLFQGTFNPLHNGHVAMANFVKKYFDYDKIIFVPAYKPPHKNYDENLAHERYNIVKTYVSNHNEFEVSDIEFKREAPSYTYITVRALKQIYDYKGKFGFIIGQDAFSEIDTWYETEKLKEFVEFIVFLRENEAEPEFFKKLAKQGYNYRIADWQRIQVSSTEIRKLLKEKKNCSVIKNLIPQEVLEYIKEHELYI